MNQSDPVQPSLFTPTSAFHLTHVPADLVIPGPEPQQEPSHSEQLTRVAALIEDALDALEDVPPRPGYDYSMVQPLLQDALETARQHA